MQLSRIFNVHLIKAAFTRLCSIFYIQTFKHQKQQSKSSFLLLEINRQYLMMTDRDRELAVREEVTVGNTQQQSSFCWTPHWVSGQCEPLNKLTSLLLQNKRCKGDVSLSLPLNTGVSRVQHHTASASLDVNVCLNLIQRLLRAPLATVVTVQLGFPSGLWLPYVATNKSHPLGK